MTGQPPPLVAPDAPRVGVTITARVRHLGPRRLPDRRGPQGPYPVIGVESPGDAAEVLRGLDREGRTLMIDVERKGPAHLWALARELCPRCTLVPVKPNDTTVDAVDAVVAHGHGPDPTGADVAVLGIGNIGFKVALRLAERGARLHLWARDREHVARSVEVINRVLPAHTPHPARAWAGGELDVMVSVLGADRVVDADWAQHLAPSALVLDVGIDNFTPAFIGAALERGARFLRVDVRAADGPTFFSDVMGTTTIAGHPAVAGGIVASRGTAVLDRITPPHRLIGLCTGTGGLIPPDQLTAQERTVLDDVSHHLSATEEGR